MNRAKKQIDVKEIQALISNNQILAAKLHRAVGKVNVLLPADVEEWLRHAPYISNVLQLLYDFTAPEATDDLKASLLEEMKPLSRIIQYITDSKTEHQKLTYFSGAFEILENKRLKLDQLPVDELVIPAYLLLPAAENRDLLQNDLGYDLSQYGLPFWRELDPDTYYDLLENMGPADSFDEAESIIPLEVLDDILTITQSIVVSDFGFAVETSKDLNSPKETQPDPFEKFVFWKTKYPVLQNMRPDEFRATLLQHYVQPPSSIIKLLGDKVLCTPFQIQSKTQIFQSRPWIGN